MRDYFERLLGMPSAVPAPSSLSSAPAQPYPVSGLHITEQDDIEEIVANEADETGDGETRPAPLHEDTSSIPGGKSTAPGAAISADGPTAGESTAFSMPASDVPATPFPSLVPAAGPPHPSGPLPALSATGSAASPSASPSPSFPFVAGPASSSGMLHQASTSSSQTAAILDQVLQWIAAGQHHTASTAPQAAPLAPQQAALPFAPSSPQISGSQISQESTSDPSDAIDHDSPSSHSAPFTLPAVVSRSDQASRSSLATSFSSAAAPAASPPSVTIGALHVSIEAPPPTHRPAPLSASPPSPPSPPFVPPSLPDRSRMSRHYLSPR